MAVMSYRPMTDVWILARSKVKYYGAYPAGFLQRARDLIGCRYDDPVLHVCSGQVRAYPHSGVGRYDMLMDIDPGQDPDIIGDANTLGDYQRAVQQANFLLSGDDDHPFQGVLADPPYTPADAERYKITESFPTADAIVAHSLSILPIGGRVGILSLSWPRYPKAISRQVAVIAVYVGNGNLGRTFAVYERTT